MADRIEKPVAIARSGVYQYLRRELPGLKLPPVPDKYADIQIFNVYRPAPVLAAAKDLFAKIPIIREHQAEVTPENFQELAQGWTGDSVEMELTANGEEAVIKSTVNILNEEGIRLYEAGQKEVSPYYFGDFSWKEGEHNGQPYQITMDSIQSVNHLAMVSRGRGGRDAVIDSAMGGGMDYKTSLMRNARRMAAGVKDGQPGEFQNILQNLIKARMALTAEMIDQDVNKLRLCVWDLPDNPDKALLLRYLDDVKHFRDEENDKVVETAGKIISELYDKLDGVSVLEVMNEQEREMGKGKDEAPPKEEEKKPMNAPAEEGKAKDADPEGETLLSDLKAFHKHLHEGTFGKEGAYDSLSQHMQDGGKIADWEPLENLKKDDGKAKDEDPKEEKGDKAEGKAKDAENTPKDESDKPSEKVDTEKEAKEVKDKKGTGDSSPFNMSLAGGHAGKVENPFLKNYLRKEGK